MNKKYSASHRLASCLICFLLGALLVLGVLFFAFGGIRGVRTMVKLNAVRYVIDKEYVGETQWESETDAASAAMIDALGDQWSYYMTAEEYSAYKDHMANTSSGIGVTITADEASGGFAVVAVVAGSPAENAGIVQGDIIIGVEDEDMRGKTIDELKSAIQSREGDFSLRLINSSGEERSVTVSRQALYSSPVSFEMKENNIGYVRIMNFRSGCSSDAKAAVESLMADGAQSLIFDVRANGGGLLGQLVELLDYLLPEGDIFVSVGKDGKEYVYTSKPDSIDLPMVVLFDANSYSAAEFFAAALSEYGVATTIGEQSTGKGRSQGTYELYDGSAVHISSNLYLTPNRIDLSEQGGLVPDITVEKDALEDKQLAAAIEYLS